MVKIGFASREEIVNAIKSLSEDRKIVPSQRRLRDLVSIFLEGKKIGERRLRKIAIEEGLVRVRIIYREGKDSFNLERCPVCGRKISKVYGKDIWGRNREVEFICKRCGYRSGIRRKIPTRYIFYIGKKD